MVPFFLFILSALGIGTFISVFHFTQVVEENPLSYFSVTNQVEGEMTGEYTDEDRENIEEYLTVLRHPHDVVTEQIVIDRRQISFEVTTKMEEHLEVLLQEEIEPRYPIFVQISDYVFWTVENYTDENTIEQESEYYRWTPHRSHYGNGWQVLWFLIIENIPFIIVVVLSLVFSSFLSSDYNKQRNHLNLFKVEGLNPMVLHILKFKAVVLHALLFLFTYVSSILITSLFFNGLGDLRYPLYSYYTETEFSPITLGTIRLGDYLLESSLLIFLCILFFFAFIQLAGPLIKNETLTNITGLVFVGLIYYMPAIPYTPFYFFQIDRVITGSSIFWTTTDFFTFGNGVGTLFVYSILFLTAGMLVLLFKKKRT